MNPLEKIRSWLQTYPEIGKVMGLNVDYYSTSLDKSSIAPAGLQEISRAEDILGNVTVNNQYSFNLEFVFPKAPGDDEGAAENAQWLLAFQNWVQQQSIARAAPVFGDEPKKETVLAQNGTNEYATVEGMGIYTVILTVKFIKKFEV